MARKNTKFVDVNNLLAVAIKVFDNNKGQVYKEAVFAEGSDDPVHIASKHSARELLEAGFEPNEELLERARELRQSILQKRMVDELKGLRPNAFFLSIYAGVVTDTVPEYSIALLVWAPKLMADTIKRDEADVELQASSVNSQYVGKVGEKVCVKYIPIRSRYLQNFNKWTNLGQDEAGNLIAFWSNNEVAKETMLQGRIKKHEVSRFAANSRVTQMNYVKEI